MHSAEAFRKYMSKHLCGEGNMPALVIETKGAITVLCCCTEFTAQLKTQMDPLLKKRYKGLNVTFVTGHLDFV